MEDRSGERPETAAEETVQEITEQHGTGRKRERDREIPSKRKIRQKGFSLDNFTKKI